MLFKWQKVLSESEVFSIIRALEQQALCDVGEEARQCARLADDLRREYAVYLEAEAKNIREGKGVPWVRPPEVEALLKGEE